MIEVAFVAVAAVAVVAVVVAGCVIWRARRIVKRERALRIRVEYQRDDYKGKQQTAEWQLEHWQAAFLRLRDEYDVLKFAAGAGGRGRKRACA